MDKKAKLYQVTYQVMMNDKPVATKIRRVFAFESEAAMKRIEGKHGFNKAISAKEL